MSLLLTVLICVGCAALLGAMAGHVVARVAGVS